MDIDKLLDAAPPVSYEMLMDVLAGLVEHYAWDEYQNYQSEKVDRHVFVFWVVVMTWLYRNKEVQ